MSETKRTKDKANDPLRLSIDFEEALEALLQVKPIENADLKKPKKAKKKSKPKK